ncbi:MAG: PLP-dependent aminotransferase family protein [Oscillospiraceae bacterium]|nr:PLP-dependent aminotransferase family protein [Oscillospiraceae bacterium]
MEYTKYMADRVKTMKGSAIREMFKRMADPEIISLAGGNPAAELFPGDELSKIAGKILMTSPTLALQYGTTDGYPKMKDCARKRAEKVNSVGENDEILIMTGANQGIDLTAKAVLNKGDKIIVESPSFIGSLNAFRTYEAELLGVTVEDDGMSMEELEKTLQNNSDAKIIYTIPTFQNPTGVTMSLEKRKKMLELASKYDVLILEDNPYGDLRFSGEDVPTVKSLDTEGRVIYAGSFSKILSPGMRLGYIVAPAPLAEKIEVLKQVNDVHTPMLTQLMCVEFMKKYDIDKYIAKNRELYGKKCACMIENMEKYFPEGKVKWVTPEGGLFLWCECPTITDISPVVEKCLEKKVAIVPGSNFAIDMFAPSNMFRLNYSSATLENIAEGVKRIGEVLTELL